MKEFASIGIGILYYSAQFTVRLRNIVHFNCKFQGIYYYLDIPDPSESNCALTARSELVGLAFKIK